MVHDVLRRLRRAPSRNEKNRTLWAQGPPEGDPRTRGQGGAKLACLLSANSGVRPVNGPPVRNMLGAILDHQTTSVVMVDEALRVQYLNPAAEFLLAASFERARGESLGALLRDSNSFLGELTGALDRG